MNENAAALALALIITAVVIGAGASSYIIIEGKKAADIEPETVIQQPVPVTDEEPIGNTTYTPKISIEEYMVETKKATGHISTFFNVNPQKIGRFSTAISELNIRVYRLQNTTCEEATKDYIATMKEDRYNISFVESKSGDGWEGTGIFATKGLYGRGIVIAAGSTVESLLDCDVVVITSHALLTTYLKWKDVYETQIKE